MTFTPTNDNVFEVAGGDFAEVLAQGDAAETRGDYLTAVEVRWAAFHALVEALPDEAIELDWDDDESQAAIEVGYRTGLDHFLASDWELAAAIFEQVLEFDPEDHFGATIPLCYCYAAMQDWERYDDAVSDISDKEADRAILELWSGWRREGKVDAGELRHFRTRFAPYYAEFCAAEHDADDVYLRDIRSERPSSGAIAREKWLGTEHIWVQYPQFIAALR